VRSRDRKLVAQARINVDSIGIWRASEVRTTGFVVWPLHAGAACAPEQSCCRGSGGFGSRLGEDQALAAEVAVRAASHAAGLSWSRSPASGWRTARGARRLPAARETATPTTPAYVRSSPEPTGPDQRLHERPVLSPQSWFDERRVPRQLPEPDAVIQSASNAAAYRICEAQVAKISGGTDSCATRPFAPLTSES
jgi:hypothetical protein